MSERSPEYLSGYQAGFVDGYFTDSEQIAPIVAILTDLIAELRDEHNNGDGYCGAALEAADRAEQRLRDVQGE